MFKDSSIFLDGKRRPTLKRHTGILTEEAKQQLLDDLKSIIPATQPEVWTAEDEDKLQAALTLRNAHCDREEKLNSQLRHILYTRTQYPGGNQLMAEDFANFIEGVSEALVEEIRSGAKARAEASALIERMLRVKKLLD